MSGKPTIYFDLDGTLYPLYQQENWLERITTLADPTAYAVEAMMVDEIALQEVLFALVEQGYEIGVVTWLAGGSTLEYDKAVRPIKRNWIKKFLPMATEIHIVKYGTKKHSVIKNRENAILVDDNADVLRAWTRGDTIDATGDIIAELNKILERSKMSEWEIVARILASDICGESCEVTQSEIIEHAFDRAKGM